MQIGKFSQCWYGFTFVIKIWFIPCQPRKPLDSTIINLDKNWKDPLFGADYTIPLFLLDSEARLFFSGLNNMEKDLVGQSLNFIRVVPYSFPLKIRHYQSK